MTDKGDLYRYRTPDGTELLLQEAFRSGVSQSSFGIGFSLETFYYDPDTGREYLDLEISEFTLLGRFTGPLSEPEGGS